MFWGLGFISHGSLSIHHQKPFWGYLVCWSDLCKIMCVGGQITQREKVMTSVTIILLFFSFWCNLKMHPYENPNQTQQEKMLHHHIFWIILAWNFIEQFSNLPSSGKGAQKSFVLIWIPLCHVIKYKGNKYLLFLWLSTPKNGRKIYPLSMAIG